MTVATIAEELDINRAAAGFIMVEPKNITSAGGKFAPTFARNQGK
jgi:hypothetical protein